MKQGEAKRRAGKRRETDDSSGHNEKTYRTLRVGKDHLLPVSSKDVEIFLGTSPTPLLSSTKVRESNKRRREVRRVKRIERRHTVFNIHCW